MGQPRHSTELTLGLLSLALSLSLGASLPKAALAQTSLPVEVRQGYSQIQRGQVLQAVQTLERAVRRYPRSLEARLGLAIAYRRQGLDEKALTTYEQVIQLDPTNDPALRAVGLLGSYRPEWWARGIRALTSLLQLKPDDLEVRLQRATLSRYAQNWPQAIADYEILLRSNPSPSLLLAAAQAYNWGSRYPQALNLFNQVQQQGQAITGDAALAYGNALGQTGRLREAASVLIPLIQQRRGSQLADNAIGILTSLYTDNGDDEGLLALYDQLLRQDPDNPSLNLAYGATAYQLNRISMRQAQTVLDTWLARTPDLTNPPPALYGLVAKLPPDLAREALYLQLINQNPNPDDTRIAERYAQALVRQAPQLARSRAEQGVASNPSLSNYILLGRVYQALGDYDRAAAAYDSILVQQPRNLTALLAWAESEAARKNYEFSRQLYNEARAVQAQSPRQEPGRRIQIGRGLSEAFRGDGRPQAAIRQLEQLQSEVPLSPAQQADLLREIGDIEQGFLLQRGFQPPWERF